MESHTFTVPMDTPKQRADSFLAQNYPLISRTQIKRLIEAGHLLIQDKIILDASFYLHGGETLILQVPPPVDPHPKGQAMELMIPYEDDHILVIDKPAGLVVHPAPGNPDQTLVNALIAHCGDSLSGIGGVRRPGIVHRLDKGTSGLLVVAKSDRAHQKLTKQFTTRTISRKYLALIPGVLMPPSGTIIKNIDRSRKNRLKMTTVTSGGKEAITHFSTVETLGPLQNPKIRSSLISCRLETGRTHQIRVHLADLKHPLLGDDLYGQNLSTHPLQKILNHLNWPAGRQALHAESLSFIHPITSEELSFSSPLPEDLTKLKEVLKTIPPEGFPIAPF